MLKSVKRHINQAENKKVEDQFPPPFKRTPEVLKKVSARFLVHENPQPGDCEECGMKYEDLQTGLDFQAVKDMLWVADNDSTYWRHKGRHSVLGLWHEIKEAMWLDHITMCSKPTEQSKWINESGFDYDDFEY